MLELHINDTDITTGSIPVSWCVDAESLKLLAEKGIKNPYIVIITAPKVNDYYLHSSKESRIVVPLSDLMTYIDFHYAGECKVYAFISTEKNAQNEYLCKKYDKYATDVIGGRYIEASGNKQRPCYLFQTDILCAEPLDVNVPKDIFAPEPFDKAWVNWIKDDKYNDQCHYRKWRLFAYSVQPILFIFHYLIKLILLSVALFFGLRKTPFKLLIQPLTSLGDCLDDNILEGGTIFIGRGKNIFLNYARLLFMPIIMMFELLIISLFIVSLKMGLIVISTIVVGVIISGLINHFSDVKDFIGIIGHSLFTKEESDQEAWYLNPEEMQTITCSPNKARPMNVSDLPYNHRTFKLRFKELKSKVCKPFSR